MLIIGIQRVAWPKPQSNGAINIFLFELIFVKVYTLKIKFKTFMVIIALIIILVL